MSYSIHSIFDTIQGEGARAGTRAIFVRTSGCNLWDGNPDHRDRGKGACSRWCDTDFFCGRPMSADDIAARATSLWSLSEKPCAGDRWVVLTGGEPALQLDQPLLDALRGAGFRVAVESNGTVDTPVLHVVDHLCVSPKLGSVLRVLAADELKVVVPGVEPDALDGAPVRILSPARGAGLHLAIPPTSCGLRFERGFIHPQPGVAARGWDDSALAELAARGRWGRLFVSPQDGPYRTRNLKLAIGIVHRLPAFALSLQTHKILQLP